MRVPTAPEEFKTGWLSLIQAQGPLATGSLVLLLVALPLAPSVVPLSLVLFIVLLVAKHRRSIKLPLRGRWSTPLPWSALFMVWHVLAMGWTTDLGFGLFDLQIKAPLLIVPLVALVLPKLPGRARDTALFIHVLSNALAVVICVILAVVRILFGTDVVPAQEIFSSAFSVITHPSYFALYLCMALAAWVLTPIHSWSSSLLSRSILLLLCAGIVLCGSKLGWIALVLLLLAALAMRWRDRALRTTLLGMALATAVGLAGLIGGSPYARDRVQEAWRSATQEPAGNDARTSSAVRKLTWSAAKELFLQAPLLGTGTGDIKNELLRVYGERGQQWARDHRLNAHSQFLQSAACLGIFGVLALVMMVMSPLFDPRRRDALVLVFVALCALNWSVESMLEVQAGVVWTAVMMYLLFGEGPVAIK